MRFDFTVLLYSICTRHQCSSVIFFKTKKGTIYHNHTEKSRIYSISFHIEWDMIVVTVILSILNQMEIHLVRNRKVFQIRVFSVQAGIFSSSTWRTLKPVGMVGANWGTPLKFPWRVSEEALDQVPMMPRDASLYAWHSV